MNDAYMLNQMDRWITGNYGEDRYDNWLDEPEYDEFNDFSWEEDEDDE